MIYDVSTRELRTNAGTLLKVLNCPLHKQWDELTPIPGVTPQRHCHSCHKSVLDVSTWSDDVAEMFLSQDPSLCVYAAPDATNVRVDGYRRSKPGDPCPFRRINTARGVEAINEAVTKGFWPLVKRVEPSDRIQDWMAVYQNVDTGEIQTVNDYRYGLKSPWKQVVKPFAFYPHPVEHHIAAYLLPSDLRAGEQVFLTDLIEDLVGIFGNQGDKYRLDCAYAFWNGKCFEIEWDEDRDAAHWIG